MKKNILVTGGAGFIGSNFVRHALQKYSSWNIVNLDALTYAGNLKNLCDVEESCSLRFECSHEKQLIRRQFEYGNISVVIRQS